MKTVVLNYQALISEQAKLKGVGIIKTSASMIDGWGPDLLHNLYALCRGAYGSTRRRHGFFKSEGIGKKMAVFRRNNYQSPEERDY